MVTTRIDLFQNSALLGTAMTLRIAELGELDNNNNNGNFLFPTNTTLHDDTHHSQLGMTGKFTSSN